MTASASFKTAAAAAVAAVLSALAIFAFPEAPGRPVRGAPGDPPEPAGVYLTLENESGRFVRQASWIALYVERNGTPSAFLKEGPFRAVFEGEIHLRGRSDYEFAAEGAGSVSVEVAGRKVYEAKSDAAFEGSSERMRLQRGATPIRVVYEAPGADAAAFRLLWRQRGFPFFEPVPPAVLRPPGEGETASAFDADGKRARGRDLYVAYRCFGCHGDSTEGTDPSACMPEDFVHGPDIGTAARRLEPGFLFQWLKDPASHRADARMPDLLHGLAEGERESAAAHLTAWLLSLTGPPAAPPLRRIEEAAALAKEGGALFADLGCIACHTLPSRMRPDAGDDRIPLRNAPKKFRQGALAAFLRAPAAHYPGIRMPDFTLSDREADCLEAFIRGHGDPVPHREPPPGDAEAGRELAGKFGCHHCHPGAGEGARIPVPVEDPARGCLGDSVPQGAPRYPLGPEDREDLSAFVAHPSRSLDRLSLVEEGERLIGELRCTACHAFEGAPDRWTLLAGETERFARKREGALEQARPDLTYAGDKLHSAWMARFLAGPRPAVRPWLHGRMPAFPVFADYLAEGLSSRHGVAPGSARARKTEGGMVEAGGFLVSKDGFGCTACHALEGVPPYAQFEVGANDLSLSYERLRYDHYLRWMWNPRRIDAASRMPVYVDMEGTTQWEDVLDGDGRRQFEAMFDYMSTLGGGSKESGGRGR